ncbi:hypothetical protein LTR56_010247 [Elasticomyces elasticus]|nr:hypothetical protein LTR56_010247 [Elasticomyces elasticus]KAK3658317.1 hypothetical protein LTR22_009018 [Elasticomyces elasticus]KAK4922923.1 hypothetical protein LTR49_009754 [Elasticomyces elasticus]KAK5745205.1 hypothetical protein LTS12_023211 [Elasticomyces elasticus]
MPKEIRPSMARPNSAAAVPYPAPSTATQRNAAIWSVADDDVLMQARASGLNWQPIASRHFPNKTANACRKRHERLIERRHVEDWDAQKLELLAQEYAAVRKEMWEILASRVGERWAVLEAKCMEKGLKSLQSTARTAQRRASAGQGQLSFEDRGNSDHNSDSGIGLGGSDAEMEVGDVGRAASTGPSQHAKSASWHAPQPRHAALSMSDHIRSRSLPQPLPLYQPPPPIISTRRTFGNGEMTASPDDVVFPTLPTNSRYSPDSNGRGGISIQSVLSPMEPQYLNGAGTSRRPSIY